MNTQETRTGWTSSMNLARAAAAFLLLVVMGYAFSISPVESSLTSAPAVTAPQDLTPTPYFPAQFANQGTAVEEPIQAF